jgi:hypothetical protein
MKITVSAALLALAAAYPSASTSLVLDLDGDGFYSLEELRREYPALSTATFASMDTNGDSLVSPTEFRLAQDAQLLPQAITGF